MNNQTENIKLYTLQDLSGVLNVTTRTLKTYVNTGRLKGVKIGGKWTVTEENLRHFINGEPQQ